MNGRAWWTATAGATALVAAAAAQGPDPRGGPALFYFNLGGCSSDGPLAIPDNSPAGVASTITIPPFNGMVGDVDVLLNITHTCVGDLEITLTAPDGTTALLIDSNRDGGILVGLGCGANFTDTILDDENVTNLANGAPPYTGGFNAIAPGADLLASLDYRRYAGTWTLRVRDEQGADVGTLNHWCLLLRALPTVCPGDLTGDNLVNSDDLAFLLGYWGGCPVLASETDPPK